MPCFWLKTGLFSWTLRIGEFKKTHSPARNAAVDHAPQNLGLLNRAVFRIIISKSVREIRRAKRPRYTESKNKGNCYGYEKN